MLTTDVLLHEAIDRGVLLANHVLRSSDVGMGRFQRHAGRVMRLNVHGWASRWPAPPVLWLRVTRAGLLEAVPETESAGMAPDLEVRIAAQDPMQALRAWWDGHRPPAAIDGDAALAADVNWAIEHLRWDVAADAHRAFGPVAARGVEWVGERWAALLSRRRASRMDAQQ